MSAKLEQTAEVPTAGEPQRLGRYVLLNQLASGGMATLYLARLSGPQGFEKLFAIKAIHEHLSRDQNFIDMFADEARLAAQISHPNVVQIVELGHEAQRYFIVMEYVAGETLSTLLRNTKPPLEVCVRIIADAAAGLHAAHRLRGKDGRLLHVVHRDVSPQNILISYQGAVKVVDFGVAKVRGSLHTSQLGSVVGKMSYMAPEQALSRPVDCRADIFSLGVVLYEITTGERLFGQEEARAEFVASEGRALRRPREVVASYPDALQAIALKALAFAPEERFASAQELQDELETFLRDTTGVTRTSQLSACMQRTFRKEIEEKTVTYGLPATLVQAAEPQTAMERPTPTGATQGRRRVGRWIAAAIAVGVVLGAVAVGARWFREPGRQAQRPSHEPRPADSRSNAAPPADLAVARAMVDADRSATASAVSISIAARPAGATIVVDGERVRNPFDRSYDQSSRQLRVAVSARGHAPRALRISLARSSHYEVQLERRQRPHRGHRKLPRRKPPAAKSESDVFLKSPYAR